MKKKTVLILMILIPIFCLGVEVEVYENMILVHVDGSRSYVILPNEVIENAEQIHAARLTSIEGHYDLDSLYHPLVQMIVITNLGVHIVHFIATPILILVGTLANPPCGSQYHLITGKKKKHRFDEE